jgi:hypothetical protein
LSRKLTSFSQNGMCDVGERLFVKEKIQPEIHFMFQSGKFQCHWKRLSEFVPKVCKNDFPVQLKALEVPTFLKISWHDIKPNNGWALKFLCLEGFDSLSENYICVKTSHRPPWKISGIPAPHSKSAVECWLPQRTNW